MLFRKVALARFSEQLDGASKDNHLANCSFEGFEIRGERVKLKQYNPHAKGLDLQYMLRATFRDLHIYDTAATGLGCDHLQDSVIEDVMAVNCGRLNNGSQPGGPTQHSRIPAGTTGEDRNQSMTNWAFLRGSNVATTRIRSSRRLTGPRWACRSLTTAGACEQRCR